MGKEDRQDGSKRNFSDEGTRKPGERRSEQAFTRALKEEDRGVLVDVLKEWLRK